jgi:hypothetical protein
MVVLGNSDWPPTVAFMLPATEPITAEPAIAGTVATAPIRRAKSVSRNTVFFIVIGKNSF